MRKLLLAAFLLISWNINAQQPPTACFTGDSTGAPCQISFTDLSLGNPSAWTWTFAGGTPGGSAVQNPPDINFQVFGSWSVTLMVNNGFSDTETKAGVVTVTANTCFFDTTIGTPCTLATGLEDLAIVNESLTIFPNPTTGLFTVANATGEIQVYDLFGRLVLRTNKKEIDMSSYPAGLYIWSIGTARGKVVIE